MKAHWQITPLSSGLGEHAAEWDALNTRLFNAHPMLESRFVGSLLTHFGDGTEHLCVLRSNGAAEAMCLLKRGSLGIWRTFLPAQAQIGPALIPNTNALQDLIHSLPGTVTRLDILCNDPAFGDLSKGHYATATRQNHALTMNIRLDGSFESYWAARSKNLTKNMGRYERRLTADHLERKFLRIADPSDIGSAVARYAALESRGWKATQGTAINIDNEQGIFYTDLMNRFATSANALVFELWFGDQLAASRLVISSADMSIILKTTYDEAFEKYAPGRQLLKEVIQSLFHSHPGTAIEFYTDANADNLAWATGQRWIKNVSVYRSAFTENLFQLLRAGRHVLTAGRKPPERIDDDLGVSVYRHPDEFPVDVQQLFDAHKKVNIEFSAEWYRNLIHAVYPHHEGVRIYILRKKGLAVAALPILVHKTMLGHRVESLSNYYTSVYAPLIEPSLKARDLAHLLNAVRDTCKPLVSLRFAPLDPGSSSFCTLLEALHLSGFIPFRFFCFGNWYLPVHADWNDYLKHREGKLRSTIARMAKRFLAQGGRLELITDRANLAKGLAAYERVYALSWKKPEPYPHFIAGLMRTCAEKDWLRLGVAWLNGVPIAAQLWMVADGKANIYKLAYDKNYRSYSSGTLLTAMMMEHSMATDKVVEVDYLTGDDPYKRTWMSHRRERWGVIAYNPKTLQGMLDLGKDFLRRMLTPLLAQVKTLMTQKEKQSTHHGDMS